MRSSALWTALVLLLIQGTARKLGNNTRRFANATLVRLSEYLSAGYKKGVRPVRNWRNCTMVAIDLMVYSILSVGSRPPALRRIIVQYEWTDELLVWNPEDFEDVNQMSVPTANVWVPDILINEFVDVGKSQDIPYVYVTHYGLVLNYKPIQAVTAYTLNISNFPFDVQNCSLTFQSWLHTHKTFNDFDLKLMRSAEELKVDKSVFMNQGEWELLHILSKYKSFSLDNIDSYAEMKFNVVIRHRPLFYTVNLLPPSIFLMMTDPVVSFKITLLLGYSVFLIIVSGTLPATAKPLIGVYFVVCMALLVISLKETVLIVRLVHKQDLQPHVPQWLKHLVLEEITVLLCIRNKHSLCSMLSRDYDHVGHYKENNNSQDRPWRRGQQGAGSGEPGGPARGHEISSIRGTLEKKDKCRDIAKEWLQVGYVLDVLLFRVYLLAMLAYSITLGTLWSMCQYP
uniref:5-hydroxytryptamine receptor 3A n=1 Tax=Oncorhynchus tshawytscha TaxID=74940 RepID=A0A8C8H7X2_ONCTS